LLQDLSARSQQGLNHRLSELLASLEREQERR